MAHRPKVGAVKPTSGKTGSSASVGERRRILTVDDQPVLREGLQRILELQPDLCACCQAADASGALAILARNRTDLVILGLSLGDTNGLELIKDIHAQYPRLPVLVFSGHDEEVYAERCLRAGARGFVSKRETSARLLEAVRQVLRGEVYLSRRMTRALLQRIATDPAERQTLTRQRLSDRELEIFELIGRGQETREIAARLHLSPKTVAAHRANIKQKLQLRTAKQLVRHAIYWVQETGGD